MIAQAEGVTGSIPGGGDVNFLLMVTVSSLKLVSKMSTALKVQRKSSIFEFTADML